MPIDTATAAFSSPVIAERPPQAALRPEPPRPKHDAGRRQDWLFEHVTLFFALFVLLLLAGILIALAISAAPALQKFGPAFFFTNVWNPVKNEFGGLAPIYGTLMTSAIALVIGVPVSFGIALFLTEMCPPILKRPLGTAVELLAAIPSIIYGMWGLFIFAPLFGDYVQPLLTQTIGHVPIIGRLFQGAPNGIGILSAGVILSVMIIPFISSVMRDVFEIVPPVLKESAYGIGCTTWEVVRRVVIPHTRAGVIGAIMLALGRALGETMAVTFVIGNAHRIAASILAPGTTISATIANEFTEAVGDLYTSARIALGLILFVITFFVLAIARYMLMRLNARVGA